MSTRQKLSQLTQPTYTARTRDTFHSTKSSENSETKISGSEIFRESFQKINKLLKIRRANHLTKNSGNSMDFLAESGKHPIEDSNSDRICGWQHWSRWSILSHSKNIERTRTSLHFVRGHVTEVIDNIHHYLYAVKIHLKKPIISDTYLQVRYTVRIAVLDSLPA